MAHYRSEVDGEPCPVEHALGVLEGRWTVLILRELFRQDGCRFNDLRRRLGNLSPRTLTDRLKALEDQGVVARRVTPGRPPGVTYSLTPRGSSLWPMFEAMMRWSEEDLKRPGKA